MDDDDKEDGINDDLYVNKWRASSDPPEPVKATATESGVRRGEITAEDAVQRKSHN